jgi:hypothetical protein
MDELSEKERLILQILADEWTGTQKAARKAYPKRSWVLEPVLF